MFSPRIHHIKRDTLKATAAYVILITRCLLYENFEKGVAKIRVIFAARFFATVIKDETATN